MDYKKLLYASIVLFVSIILVFFNDRLNLYIHPRYLFFTMIFVFIGLALLIVDLLTASRKETVSRSGYIVIFIALVSLFIPPQSLSAQLASNRVDNSQKSNSSLSPTTYDSFSRDLTRFGIEDWVSFLSSSPSEEQIVGTTANVSGFITQDSTTQLYVARFKLTCCAVDATPLTIPILSNDISGQLNIGDWYILKGKFVYVQDSVNKYQLDISEFEAVTEPKEPYVY